MSADGAVRELPGVDVHVEGRRVDADVGEQRGGDGDAAARGSGIAGSGRGQGTFVSLAPPVLPQAQKRERVRDTARRLVREAALVGLPFPRLLALLEEEERALRAEQRAQDPAEPGRRKG